MVNDANKKNQLILTSIHIILMIIFIVGLVLNWNYEKWEGVKFEVRDGSVFTDIFGPIIASLEYSFSSKNNIIFLYYQFYYL